MFYFQIHDSALTRMLQTHVPRIHDLVRITPVFLTSTEGDMASVQPQSRSVWSNANRCTSTRSGRCLVISQAGKGFGQKKPAEKLPKGSTKKIKGRGKKAIDKAIGVVEGSKGVRPIDPKEAAKGKVDFVQVKDWGSGEPDDLANLQVDSYASDMENVNLPFCDRLAKHLQMLEAKGTLSLAQGDMVPFEKWSFKEERYRQYICDQAHVNQCLEQAIDRILSHEQATASGTEGGCLASLSQFSKNSGLDRGPEFLKDLKAISNGKEETQPTPQATAYGKYLEQLARKFSSRESDNEFPGACELIAHSYSIHVTHLTTGTRIGATATEKLNLFTRKATNAFQTYPDSVEDPLKHFLSAINKTGEHLSDTETLVVMEELAPAFRKTALLFEPLAHED